MNNRLLKADLIKKASRKHGRITVVTGARQTGKTTLVKICFPDWSYISLDDPAVRPSYTGLTAADWVERTPRAIVDEVQKAPAVVEALKAAFDADPNVRFVLLGSSQILLLSKVKESLAGRVTILDLWPLTLPEMATSSWDEELQESRLLAWLESGPRDARPLIGVATDSREFARNEALLDRYLQIGGMPAVHDPDLDDDERQEWLRNYQRTYLERDVADLANLRDLEPFVLAQRALASRTGGLVNFSDLARLVSITPATARRFLRYLELSYQVLELRPYHRNLDKRLAKMPKVHFLDPGVLRGITRRWGTPTGGEFESAVVAEIFKQIRSARLDVDFFHLRTYDGREVDLLLELEAGFIAIEIKLAARVSAEDARPLRDLALILDKPLLMSLLVSRDREPRLLEQGVVAVPAAWLLGPHLAKATR